MEHGKVFWIVSLLKGVKHTTGEIAENFKEHAGIMAAFFFGSTQRLKEHLWYVNCQTLMYEPCHVTTET